MLKKKLLLALVVCWPSYSYCDSQSIKPYYGYTGNAVSDQALRWSMGSVLPTPPGLDINAVIYNYTIQKETEDHVTVHVQNENANGTGYVFRSTDDWKPGSLGGTEINKVVGVGSVHRSLWGDGSIEVEGNGSISNPSVVYTYTIDPCYDPQYSPNCPGYKVQMPNLPEVSYEIYDATQHANQYEVYDDEQFYEDEESVDKDEAEKEEAEEEKDRAERLEKALAEADNSAMFAQALASSQMLDSLKTVTFDSYYTKALKCGVYNDTVTLNDTQLPDGKSGLRNGLAQQLLHQKMVEMQYEK